MVGDWNAFLLSALSEDQLRNLRQHGRTGRPFGNATFLERVESIVGRIVSPKKAGRLPKIRKLP